MFLNETVEVEGYCHTLIYEFIIRATGFNETFKMLVVVFNAVDMIFLVILVNRLFFRVINGSVLG